MCNGICSRLHNLTVQQCLSLSMDLAPPNSGDIFWCHGVIEAPLRLFIALRSLRFVLVILKERGL